ncbi:MAG TPA: hypothetical protein VFW00_11215, partial [Rhodocyclaceae bacterium]|nr:hypothetical protein [Rhodocyclaceae bacterium]
MIRKNMLPFLASFATIFTLAVQTVPAFAQVPAWARESAPNDGWAGQDGGTKGGADANADHVYTVTTVDQLRNAVSGFRSRIVLIKGLIDASEGRPFSSTGDQKVRGVIYVSSNTTIVGLGNDAKVINANFMLGGASQVILRNLTIENPCDAGPTFDGSDGPTGNWNSEFD